MNQTQFNMLFSLYKIRDGKLSREDTVNRLRGTAGKADNVLKGLEEAGFTDSGYHITESGIAALEPFKVKNAVIMAAGMSTRFAPLSYEKPKALLKVKGEILIEREIRQLQEAGITDITVVVGYMKEKLFYLADKFDVSIVVNEDYYRYNNPSSLILVTDKMDNTYICSSDDYFVNNVFEQYVYRSYYAAVYAPGETDEYCLSTDRTGRITDVSIGGMNAWYMLGHVYFSRSFSKRFVRILKQEYDSPETRGQLWEKLYIRYISELPLYIRKYGDNEIKEFDSLEELRCFDKSYIENADSKVFTNICSALDCQESEISEIYPISTGLTNASFFFSCRGRKYVYRHPGVGTEAYINRKAEALAMNIAQELKLDNTFICMDENEGWKLSYYIDNARTMDYGNDEDVSKALALVRRLHTSGRSTPYSFNIRDEIRKFEETIARMGRSDFEDRTEMHDDIDRIYRLVDADDAGVCLCHCDCYDPNFLIDDSGNMNLIDWEYAGMADPATDIGTFLACSDYTMGKADETIAVYLQHTPGVEELRHYIAYGAILSYYWFVWALYQDSVGKTVGSYLYQWYRCTKAYSKRTLKLYRNEETPEGDE